MLDRAAASLDAGRTIAAVGQLRSFLQHLAGSAPDVSDMWYLELNYATRSLIDQLAEA